MNTSFFFPFLPTSCIFFLFAITLPTLFPRQLCCLKDCEESQAWDPQWQKKEDKEVTLALAMCRAGKTEMAHQTLTVSLSYTIKSNVLASPIHRALQCALNHKLQPHLSPLLLPTHRLESRTNSGSWLLTWSCATSENVGQSKAWLQHYLLQAVCFGQFLDLPGPQFPHLQNVANTFTGSHEDDMRWHMSSASYVNEEKLRLDAHSSLLG